ncbi:MAG: PAS domain-containing sensor histidine kinase [Kiloniellales bacterium]
MSPFRLALRITAAVFAIESLFMLALPVLVPLLDSAGTASLWGVATLDATLMAAVTGPIVYFWALRPYNRARAQAEAVRGRSEKALAKAQRLTKLGTWRWSIERDELISCSAEYARIHGVGLDEIHHLMHDHNARVAHPDDRDRIAAVFACADAERAGYEIEYRILRPDGEVRHILEIGEAVTDAAGRTTEHFGTIQDITDHKRVEDALHDSQSLYEGLIKVAPVSIFVQSAANGKIIFANDRGVNLLGVSSRDEVIGRSLIEFLHPDLRSQAQEQNRRILGGEAIDPVIEGKVVRIDGAVIDVERSVSGCTYDGEPALQSVLYDVTERNAGEQAIVTAQEEAVLANRAKSEFLANMSHELRTPLNAIIGFAELIGAECFGPLGDAKYRDYVQDISASGKHLLALINDILDLSKIESGRMELREENIDVTDTVRSCLRFMGERARNGELELAAEIDEATIPLLRADLRMLKQILFNMLSNAIKFTPPGGKVIIRAWHNRQSGYVIQVEDNGIGMARDDIPKALARFGQIDSALGRKYEGTGLGLSLTKSLAELHGGSLDLQSEVGAGTMVTVRFPAGRLVAQSRAPAEPAAPTPLARAGGAKSS